METSSNNGPIYIGPATPPSNFSGLTLNSTSIILTWGPPVQPNGIVTEYHLQCSAGNKILATNLSGSVHTHVFRGLQPYTNHMCEITARNGEGEGPAATKTVLTDQDGEGVNIL